MLQKGSEAVDALLAEMDHPLGPHIDDLRKLILDADPSIQEGVKWNSLSFRTTEWFATLNRRNQDRIEFVFHLGPKIREDATVSTIPDPLGMLQWKSADRCLISFDDARAVERHREPFAAIVKEWIKHV